MVRFIEINSRNISAEVFERYEKDYGYEFSPKSKAELRGAFKGKVSLEKFRPHKENSQALVLQAAIAQNLEIPTSLEWSAILLRPRQWPQKAIRTLIHF